VHAQASWKSGGTTYKFLVGVCGLTTLDAYPIIGIYTYLLPFLPQKSCKELSPVIRFSTRYVKCSMQGGNVYVNNLKFALEPSIKKLTISYLEELQWKLNQKSSHLLLKICYTAEMASSIVMMFLSLEEGIVDSIGVMELVAFVEENYKFSVKDQDVTPDNFDSVSRLATYIRRQLQLRLKLMLVQDTLHHSTERYPDKVALVCDGLRLTYSEIDQAANRLANALIDQGVRRGDRVAIYLPNSVPAVIGIYATLKAGAVFAVVNATTREDKLAYILNNCAATAIITDARGLSLLEKISGDIPSVKCAIVSASQELSQEGDERFSAVGFQASPGHLF
jgi:acyl carrier protein